MKCLIIGGNRFVGLRLSLLLEAVPGIELHILNRTGQAPECKSAVVHKGDRRNLQATHLDRNWDLIYDFAAFNQAEAEDAVKFFNPGARYIFVSSASVYDTGADLTESAFDAAQFNLAATAKIDDYQDGKRRAEAVFEQQAHFKHLCVRFPFILGPDDYTDRLNFHIDHVKNSEALYIPRLAARTSMIFSEDAARFLLWANDKSIVGPLNVASAEPISMGDLLAELEHSTGKRATLAKEPTSENRSPYARDQDWYLNTTRLNDAGFQARPIRAWLPGLLGRTLH